VRPRAGPGLNQQLTSMPVPSPIRSGALVSLLQHRAAGVYTKHKSESNFNAPETLPTKSTGRGEGVAASAMQTRSGLFAQ
jgi:hypothetical protein